MGNLQDAFNEIESLCNASDVGYSMCWDSREADGLYRNYATGAVGAPRNLTPYNGIRYTDCSGLMSRGLFVGGYFDANPWFSTVTEATYLTNAGWTEFTPTGISDLQAGDIWFYDQGGGASGHTYMVHDVDPNGSYYNVMEAAGGHISSLADQVLISIRRKLPSLSNQHWFRDLAGSAYNLHWIQEPNYSITGSNTYLVDRYAPFTAFGDECTNNACLIANYCQQNLGMSKEAICGILGNWTWESGLNPDCWNWQGVGSTQTWSFTKGGTSYSFVATDSGYGLGQWTPSAGGGNYFAYSGSPDDWMTDADANGNAQLDFLEVSSLAGQWNPASGYTWNDFKTMAGYTASQMAELFVRWWEMWNGQLPPDGSATSRKNYAQRWYDTWDSWWQKAQCGGYNSTDWLVKAPVLFKKYLERLFRLQ